MNEKKTNLAGFPVVHAAVVDGVDCGQVLEDVVVGGERRRGDGRAERGGSERLSLFCLPSTLLTVRQAL